MISKEEVKHIAELARLELSDEEVEKMQKDLTEILGYFDLLKKVPLRQGSAGQAAKVGNENLRKDEILQKDASLAEKLIAAAPSQKDGYIKVKTIL